jgi:hypothetical protein
MDKETKEILSTMSPMARKFYKANMKTDAEIEAERQSRPSLPAETTDLDDPPSFPYPYDITEKGWYFLRHLMDLSTLAKVLQVAEAPRLRPARMIGYQMRLWGPYPALIDGPPGHAVEGVACKILTQKHVDRLIAYETEKYFIYPCVIELLDVGVGRKEIVDGNVFKWEGKLDELQEGEFSLKEYLRQKKLEEI